MKRLALAALLLSSVSAHAAVYTIVWDNSEFYPTDTATFTSAITPYLAVSGQNFYHVHQQLSVGPGSGATSGAHTIFLPLGPSASAWLDLNGTNSLTLSGWVPGQDMSVLHMVQALPGVVGPVPEPSTLLAMLVGMLGVGWRRWRKTFS